MLWMPSLALSDMGSTMAGKLAGSSIACDRYITAEVFVSSPPYKTTFAD